MLVAILEHQENSWLQLVQALHGLLELQDRQVPKVTRVLLVLQVDQQAQLVPLALQAE
jgi:hypothetical protein